MQNIKGIKQMGYSVIVTPRQIASVVLFCSWAFDHNDEKAYWYLFNLNAIAYRNRYVVRHKTMTQKEFEQYVRKEYAVHKSAYKKELKRANLFLDLCFRTSPILFLLRRKDIGEYIYVCDEFKIYPKILSDIKDSIIHLFFSD